MIYGNKQHHHDNAAAVSTTIRRSQHRYGLRTLQHDTTKHGRFSTTAANYGHGSDAR